MGQKLNTHSDESETSVILDEIRNMTHVEFLEKLDELNALWVYIVTMYNTNNNKIIPYQRGMHICTYMWMLLPG